MKIGFIVPKEPEICCFPIYEEIKSSRKKASKINHPLNKYNLVSTPGRGVSYKPSIGVLSMGKSLENRGHSVKVLHEDYSEYKGVTEAQLDQLIEDSDVIGITSLTKMYPGAVSFLKAIKSKRSNLPVIIGGPHVTFNDEEAIKNGFDFVIKGYGDQSIIQLANAIKFDKGFENVDGLTFLKQESIVKNPIKMIHAGDIENPNYNLIPEEMRDKSSIPLFTSRGCPFSCNFCVENGQYKVKPIEKVLEDIVSVKEKFPFNNYFLSDSIFGIDNKRTRTLVQEINRNFPDLYFFYQNRVDLINPNMVEFLSHNNFIGLWVGLESLSDSTLKLMGKGKRENYKNYLDTLRKIKGLVPYIEGSFIIGYPGDTKKDLHITLHRLEGLLDEGLLSSASARLFVPYPGTDNFAYPERYGLTINEKDYTKFTRHSFPPNFRTKDFSEFELYTTMLEFNSIVSRAIHNRNGVNTYDTINLAKLKEYEGK